MKIFHLQPLFAGAMVVLLTACGGGVSHPAADQASLAAPMAPLSAPVADCEAEGCNRARVVDGLAEQFRASAIAVAPAEPLPAAESVQPAEPMQAAGAVQAAEPMQAAEPVQVAGAVQAGEPAMAANEAAPGAAVALR